VAVLVDEPNDDFDRRSSPIRTNYADARRELSFQRETVAAGRVEI